MSEQPPDKGAARTLVVTRDKVKGGGRGVDKEIPIAVRLLIPNAAKIKKPQKPYGKF